MHCSICHTRHWVNLQTTNQPPLALLLWLFCFDLICGPKSQRVQSAQHKLKLLIIRLDCRSLKQSSESAVYIVRLHRRQCSKQIVRKHFQESLYWGCGAYSLLAVYIRRVWHFWSRQSKCSVSVVCISCHTMDHCWEGRIASHEGCTLFRSFARERKCQGLGFWGTRKANENGQVLDSAS